MFTTANFFRTFLLLSFVASATNSATAAITGVAVGNQSYASYTTDGSTWYEDSDQQITTGFTRQLNGVSLIDLNNAWAVGNAEGGQSLILHTSNASALNPTWTRQLGGTFGARDLQDVTFTDPNNGWAVGNNGWILRTTDGGTTWSESKPASNQLRTVDFINSSTGWAAGTGETLLKTTDGGASWNTITFNPPGSPNINDIFFTDSLTGWMVGNTPDIGLPGPGDTIYHTVDGGLNWTLQNSTITNLLEAVHFVSASEGWAVGNSGKIIHTSNGGTTWAELVDLTSVGGGNFTGVYFLDSLRGWISSSTDRIFATSDGGLNWTEQFNGDHSLQDIAVYEDYVPPTVPEPSSLVILTSLGCIGLCTLRRRQMAKT